MLFTGAYQRSLDDKHRLAIPKPLREQMPEDRRFYLTPGFDGCLALYPGEAFAALANRLGAGSPAAQVVRDYSRLFYSQAASAVADRQWRIRVPPELGRWAGLDGEVMVVGVRDHLEMWKLAKWHEYVARRDPQYDQLAEHAWAAGLGVETGAPGALSTPAEQAAGPEAPARPR